MKSADRLFMRVFYLALLCILAFGLLFCSPCPADEQPQAMEQELVLPLGAAFKAEGATTGDWVDLELNFSLPKGARLKEPVIIKGLEPLSAGQIKPIRKGLAAKVFISTLEDWSTDYLSIEFSDSLGNPGILKSQALALKIASGLPGDPAAMPPKPIRGIENISPWHKRLAPLFAALAVAGIALFFI